MDVLSYFRKKKFMKKFIYGFAALAFATIIFFGCGKFQKGYDCTGQTPTYNNDIKAIYDASCATSGCHNASHHAAGIDLSTYSAAISANNDDILGAVEHNSGYSAMPQGAGKLSDTQIKKIYCWMQNNKPM
jgi:mono/diheme cytochrome c family protein